MRWFFHLSPRVSKSALTTASCKNQLERKKYKALCSAVIYGPNTYGKTNIIGAMDTFTSIVLRGHLRNVSQQGSPNTVASVLKMIPNNSLQAPETVTFGIKFITDGLLIKYSFSADLGKFLDEEYARRILSETLKINDFVIFERENGLQFGNLEDISDYMVNNFDQNADSAKLLARSNLNRPDRKP